VGGPQSTDEQQAAPSKRRRLKLMCNGMTIYRDIDDVASAAAPARVKPGKCPSEQRRRASLPTLPVASLSNSVVKRRHVSTDNVTSDQQTLSLPSVEVLSSESDLCLTASAVVSTDDSGIGPLDYSTDRTSIGTIAINSTLPSSLTDSSPSTFDEPLELTTVQVRERQKNDCRQLQIAKQLAIS